MQAIGSRLIVTNSFQDQIAKLTSFRGADGKKEKLGAASLTILRVLSSDSLFGKPERRTPTRYILLKMPACASARVTFSIRLSCVIAVGYT